MPGVMVWEQTATICDLADGYIYCDYKYPVNLNISESSYLKPFKLVCQL